MQHYAPPPLDRAWLIAALKDAYPAHNQKGSMLELLTELVQAYIMWWQLMLTFPERHIAGPAPLWAVRCVHALEVDRFISDSLEYLGRTPQRSDLWDEHKPDYRRTLGTARSLEEEFHYTPCVFDPIVRFAKTIKESPFIRLH